MKPEAHKFKANFREWHELMEIARHEYWNLKLRSLYLLLEDDYYLKKMIP